MVMELGKVLKLLAAKLWLHKHEHLVIQELDMMTDELRVLMVLMDKDVAELLKAAWCYLVMAKLKLRGWW